MSDGKLYNIVMEDRGEYLYALAEGDVLTPEIAKMYWNEIAERCSQSGISNILIEKNFAESVSAPEMLEMGTYLGTIMADKKIAFFDRHKNEGVNDLGKVIARNNGVQMRIFSNVEEAERWIVGS